MSDSKENCILHIVTEELELVACAEDSFEIGCFGKARARAIQDVANSMARCRAAGSLEFDPDWLDKISDYDVFYWAVCEFSRHFVDILAPDKNRNGAYYLVPDATPAQYQNRRARLITAVRKQRTQSNQPET